MRNSGSHNINVALLNALEVPLESQYEGDGQSKDAAVARIVLLRRVLHLLNSPALFIPGKRATELVPAVVL